MGRLVPRINAAAGTERHPPDQDGFGLPRGAGWGPSFRVGRAPASGATIDEGAQPLDLTIAPCNEIGNPRPAAYRQRPSPRSMPSRRIMSPLRASPGSWRHSGIIRLPRPRAARPSRPSRSVRLLRGPLLGMASNPSA